MAAPTVANGRIFFVYDHTAQQKEEDDPKDSIIYFYPATVDVTQQCELCGQLMGVGALLRNLFSPDEPSIVTLSTEKYAIKHLNIYSMVLSSTLSLPDEILTNQLESLYDMFSFYQGSIDKVLRLCGNDRASFLKEMSVIWDSYLLYVRCYDDEIGVVFNRIPTVSLPKTSASLFLRASHVLQVHRRRRGVLGGCILYKNEVLMTQLSPDLTFRLCIIRPQQKHLPCQKVLTNLVLPIGVRILVVYLSHAEYRQIKPDWPADPGLRYASSGSNLEDDSLFLLQRQLIHGVGSRSSMSESDTNIDRLMNEEVLDELTDISEKLSAEGLGDEGSEALKTCSSLTNLEQKTRPEETVKKRSKSDSSILDHHVCFQIHDDLKESQESRERLTSCVNCDRLRSEKERESKTLSLSESLVGIKDFNNECLLHDGANDEKVERPKSLKIGAKNENGRILPMNGEVPTVHESTDNQKRGSSPTNSFTDTITEKNVDLMAISTVIASENAENTTKTADAGTSKPANQSPISPTENTTWAQYGPIHIETANEEKRISPEFATPIGSPNEPEAHQFSEQHESNQNENPSDSSSRPRSQTEPNIVETNQNETTETEEDDCRPRSKSDLLNKLDALVQEGIDEELAKRRKKKRKKVVVTNPQEEVKLYIQGHSNIVLLLLIEPFVEDEDELLHTLWKTSLQHLGDLEANIKECLTTDGKHTPVLPGPYNYLHYDRYEREIQGNTQPCSALEYSFTETAVQIHEEFRKHPNTTNITLRSHLSTVFGHQTPSQEVFFQSNLPSKVQLEASAPLMNTTMNKLKMEAERTLLKKHQIKLL